MSTPQTVLELVERFERNRSAYKSEQYNEARLRIEFLNPLFEALGWDVNNRQGYAEAYKDVIYEDAIKIGGATKAPDYCFRIGGTRKFFVEAKKPAINLKDASEPAFQLRRYAWSAKLPLRGHHIKRGKTYAKAVKLVYDGGFCCKKKEKRLTGIPIKASKPFHPFK